MAKLSKEEERKIKLAIKMLAGADVMQSAAVDFRGSKVECASEFEQAVMAALEANRKVIELYDRDIGNKHDVMSNFYDRVNNAVDFTINKDFHSLKQSRNK